MGVIRGLALLLLLGLGVHASWVWTDFSSGDLSDWVAQDVKMDWGGEGLSLSGSGQVWRETQINWSGYHFLYAKIKQPVGQESTAWIKDGRDQVWSTQISGSGEWEIVVLPISQWGAALGQVQALGFDLHGEMAVAEIGLSDPMGVWGPAIYLDIGFVLNEWGPTLPGIGWTTLAREIKSKGFTSVHLIDVNLSPSAQHVQGEIIDAFHRENLAVVLTLFPTTDPPAYQENPQWRQKMLGGGSAHDWRTYLSPHHPEFVAHAVSRISSLVAKYEYDGIQLIEPWLEVWGGPYRSNPTHMYYADISPAALDAFEAKHGYDALAVLFESGRSRDPHTQQMVETYSLRRGMENSPQYQEWVQFRVDEVNAFIKAILDGAREARPEIATMVSYHADVNLGPGGSREFQAQDLLGILQVAQPDGIIIQTAWQDWHQPRLDPSYIHTYGTYAQIISESGQDVVFIAQTDIGSLPSMTRSNQWITRFQVEAQAAGFDSTTLYSYSVGGYKMLDAPRLYVVDMDAPSGQWLSLGTPARLEQVGLIEGRPAARVVSDQGQVALVKSLGREPFFKDWRGYETLHLSYLGPGGVLTWELVEIQTERGRTYEVTKAYTTTFAGGEWQDLVIGLDQFQEINRVQITSQGTQGMKSLILRFPSQPNPFYLGPIWVEGTYGSLLRVTN